MKQTFAVVQQGLATESRHRRAVGLGSLRRSRKNTRELLKEPRRYDQQSSRRLNLERAALSASPQNALLSVFAAVWRWVSQSAFVHGTSSTSARGPASF